jgi:predicted dienelactone hydrolase
MTRHLLTFVLGSTLLLSGISLGCGTSAPAADDDQSIEAVSRANPHADLPGRFQVGWYDLTYASSFGDVHARIWYPAAEESDHGAADASEGPYPAIVIAPAAFSGSAQFKWLGTHLASHGYVVLSYNPPKLLGTKFSMHAVGISAGIDALERETARRASPIAGLVDTDAVGVSGVSLGGGGALEAGGKDPRIKAIVALTPGWDPHHPDNAASVDAEVPHIQAPTLLASGQLDCISAGGTKHYYDLLPHVSKEWIEIGGGNHVQFVDSAFSFQIALPGIPHDCKASVSKDEQLVVSRKYTTAWFELYLKGRKAYRSTLFGSLAHADLSSGVLSSVESAP